MGINHVSHTEIAQFALDKVNLTAEKAKKYRIQAKGLRKKLESYLAENPDFTLKKMLISGSLAKGTSLRTINDIDVACYISGADTPSDIDALLDYLVKRLRKAFPNFTPDQVKPKTYSVTVSFASSGLDVDVVPILYDGDPNWYGKLVSQDDGSFLETNIQKHLEFFRNRKKKQKIHFAQVVRLVKYWIKNVQREQNNFRFKSFMVELILAKLEDDGVDFSDYPDALLSFFNYIATSEIREQIAFTDYYDDSEIGSFSEPVQIIDPVNAKNNVSKLYTNVQANAIVEAALDAGDAIVSAAHAPTQGKTIYYWQKVFGPSFQI